MYAIINTSGRYLSIKDLRIVLSPRERIDLDSVCERRQIEESSHLKDALKKGYIKVVVKDRIGFDASTLNVNSEKQSSNLTKNDLDNLRNEISNIINDAIKGISVSSVSVNSHVTSEPNSVEQNIDSSILEQIHKKAINRLMDSTEGKVSAEDQVKVNININKKIDELENLL